MNSRLDALQAAILRVKLRHLDAWAECRQRIAARYRNLFGSSGLGSAVVLPQNAPKSNHIYNQFVLRVPRRDELRAYLSGRGVPTDVYYPMPLHLQRAFAYLGYAAGDLPEAEAASREVLAIPVFPEMTEDQQSLVVDSIKGFYR